MTDRPLPALLARRRRGDRRLIGWVPQDSAGALNPEVPVGTTIARACPSGHRDRVAELAAELGLDPVTHDPAGVAAHCDRRLTLREGRVTG